MKESLERKSREMQKEKKGSKRYNVNSVSSDDCSVINISRSDYKFCVGRRWNNK